MAISQPASWSTAQRWLHWLVAIGVVFAFALSWVMTRLADHQALLKFALYQLHKNVGVLVLAAVVARLSSCSRAAADRRCPPTSPR